MFFQQEEIQSVITKDLNRGAEISPGVIPLKIKYQEGAEEVLVVGFISSRSFKRLEDALNVMEELKLRPLDTDELKALDKKYPDMKKDKIIAALGDYEIRHNYDNEDNYVGSNAIYSILCKDGCKKMTSGTHSVFNYNCIFPVVSESKF